MNDYWVEISNDEMQKFSQIEKFNKEEKDTIKRTVEENGFTYNYSLRAEGIDISYLTKNRDHYFNFCSIGKTVEKDKLL